MRDYIDVDAILRSGRYPMEELLRLATEHDPGFDRPLFAEALAAVNRLPDTAFAPYELDAGEAAALRERVTGWSAQLRR